MRVEGDSRHVINVAIVVLVLAVLSLAGVLAWQAYERYRAADRVLLANRLADNILEAAGIQAMERGLTAAALGAPAPTPEIQRQILELRQRGDILWRRAMDIAHQLRQELSRRSTFGPALDDAQRRYSILQARRAQLDRYLAGNGKPAVDEWIDTITNFIATAARLREAAFVVSDVAPEVVRLNLTLRHWIWLTAEHAGLERGILAYYVSAREPVPPDTLDRLKAYRGVLEANVRELIAEKNLPETSPRIRGAIEGMMETFLGRFEAVRQQVYAATTSGDYQIDGATWWSEATQAVDSILTVGTAVTEVTDELARATARRSVLELTGFSVLAGFTLLAAFVSITWVRRTASALFQEKERAEVTLHSIGDAVITTDAEARVEYLNPLAEELTGWKKEEAIGRPLQEVFNIVNGFTRKPDVNPVDTCLRERRVVGLSNNTILLNRSGKEYMVEDSAAPIHNREGEVVGAVMVFYDVTSMRHAPHILSYHATHDSLTGLVNRREFERRLVELLTDSVSPNRHHALCYLDLDQFKLVNDTCGHAAGDKLLRQLTYVLQQRIREADTLARLGGDEFGLLLMDCPLEQARNIAEDLCRLVKDFRFKWGDQTFDLSVSMGLVPISGESGDPQDLLSRADAACFAAKEKGRNRVQVYRPEDADLTRRHGEMQWVSRIVQALEDDRFRLHCQPIVPVENRDDSTQRCEILVRMHDEDGKLILPGAFIPAAERYGLMTDIDRWVIRAAFNKLRECRHDSVCAINISGASLGNRDFQAYVREQLRQHGIPGERICFEITETAAVVNLQEAAHFIETLKAEGCRFALDDFGSGLSSFTYLKNLPVDYLKIDGAFVRDIVDDPLDFALVQSISEIGHLMGMKTIAEFVENEAILARLRTIGVDYAQGFGIAHPRPMTECLLS